jgi:hypothetical protein
MKLPLHKSTLLATALVLLAVPAAQAKVPAGTRTVTKGELSATLSWGAGENTVATKPHLEVSRGGEPLFDEDLAKVCELCVGLADPARNIALRDLEDDRAPEVVVDLFSGGAHCCYTTVVVSVDAGEAKTVVQSWGNGSYVLRRLDNDRVPEFVSTDDRFAYTFTAYVGSWRPPMIVDYVAGQFVDRTRRFPKRVLADIRAIDRELPNVRRYDARGLIAARAADMALAGISPKGINRYLRRALRRGDLEGVPGYPKNRGFIRALNKFLRNSGYIR